MRFLEDSWTLLLPISPREDASRERPCFSGSDCVQAGPKPLASVAGLAAVSSDSSLSKAREAGVLGPASRGEQHQPNA